MTTSRLLLIALVLTVSLGACSSRRSATHPDATNGATNGATAALKSVGFLSVALNDRRVVEEWDWKGHRVRTIRMSDPVTIGALSLSPDGSRLLVLRDGGGGEIRDLVGNVITRDSDIDGQWADDSKHLCRIRVPSRAHRDVFGLVDLMLVDPGRGQRVVAQVSGDGPETGVRILRCSVNDDEAIIAKTIIGRSIEVHAVRLSTGTITTPDWAHLGGRVPEIVAVSGNGRYAIETRISSRAHGQVVDTATGKVVSETQGTPNQISWDGHLVLERDDETEQLRATDWRTHRTRWISTAPPPHGPWPAQGCLCVSRPNSDDFALAVSHQPRQPYEQAALWLLNDQSATLLEGAVWFGAI
jgi:hypothetical protein